MGSWEEIQSVDLRDLLKLLFRDSVKLDAFIIDFFNDTYKRFADGMDTEKKINLLIGDSTKQEIILALQRQFSQAILDDKLEEVLENARRKANPSFLAQAKSRIARNKSSIAFFVFIIIIICYADTVSLRKNAIPLIKAQLSQDPGYVLDGAREDLREKRFKEAIDKAICIILMPSSNESQKIEANYILLSIEKKKTEDAQTDLEEKSALDEKLLSRLERIREITTYRTANSLDRSSSPSQLTESAKPLNGSHQDAGIQDAGIQDAGVQDAGVGVQDAGVQDASVQDAATGGGQATSPIESNPPKKKQRTKASLPAKRQLEPVPSRVPPVAQPDGNALAKLSTVPPTQSSPPDMSRSLPIEDYVEEPDHHRPTLETLHPKMVKCFEGAGFGDSIPNEIYLEIAISGYRVYKVKVLNKKTAPAIIAAITPERQQCILKIFDAVQFPEHSFGITTFPWYRFRVR